MTAQHAMGSGEDLHHKQSALLNARLLVIGLALVCLALICVTARDGLADLYKRWRYEEEYGYGFLVVAIVPLLLWRRWQAIVAESAGPRWPGLAIIILAQLCTIVAALGESYFIEQIAFVVSIMGIGIAVFGTGSIRVFTPIMLLLLLTTPLPYTLQAILTIKLQLISTDLGVALIQFFGIPVYVEGNVIDLGSYKLQVAEACSGLRYLLPLTCISFLVGYLYKAPFWKKAIVVVSAAPLTILLNSFRIAITAVLVDNFGTQMAEGFLHEFEGWVVFLMGMLLLVLVIFIIEGFQWSKVEMESIIDQPVITQHKVEPFKVLPLVLAMFVCAATLGVATSIASAYKSMPDKVREGFVDFPQQINGWVGRPAQLEPEVLEKLKATDTYNGDFTEGRGFSPVSLFVVYYDSLSKGAAIHSPRVCLPGGGWEFSSFEQRSFGELNPEVTGTYNRVVIQKGEQKMLMYYWYQQRDRRTAGEFSMKYYLLIDSFFKKRKDGALVRLVTPIGGAMKKDEAEADSRLGRFALAMDAKMSNYLPR